MKRGPIAVFIVALLGLAAAIWMRSDEARKPERSRPGAGVVTPVPVEKDRALETRRRNDRKDRGTPTALPSRQRSGARPGDPKEPGFEEKSESQVRELAKGITVRDAGSFESREGMIAYRGAGFGAGFTGGGVRFALPSRLAPAALRYELASIHVGDKEVAGRSSVAPQIRDGNVVYDRGVVEEQYVPQPTGIEHILVLARPLGEGAVSVAVDVTTSLIPRLDGGQILYGQSLSISNAVAIDAAGRSLPLDLTLAGDQVQFSVPASWLEGASYPVRIDPLIGSQITVDASVNNSWWIDGVDVAYNTVNNEWLVVWNEEWVGGDPQGESEYDVRGHRFNSAGASLGTLAIGFEFGPDEKMCSVSYATTVNRYLVAWAHDPADDTTVDDYDIKGRIVNGDGTMFAAAFDMDVVSGQEDYPDVAFDGTNWYLVRQRYTSSTNTDIYGAFFDTSGTLVWIGDPDFDSDYASGPKVAYGNGVYMVTWEKGVGPAGSLTATSGNHLAATNFGIVCRVMSTGGVANTAIITVDQNSNNNGYPDVAYGSGANFLIAWTREFTTTDHDIHARVVDSGGNFVTSGTTLIENDTQEQLRPRVAYSSNATNNQWLVAWEDGITGSFDIYVERVDSAGNVVASSEVQLSTSGSTERQAAVAWNSSNNEMLVAWLFVSTPYQYLAQRFSMDHTAPAVPTLLTPANGSYTNDTTPALDWTDSTDTGGSGLQNYDVEVDGIVSTVVPSTFTTGVLADGAHSWRVRARDNAGNVSAYSGYFTFTVDTVIPSTVTLLSPANGSTTSDSTPTFDWTDATDTNGISSYQIQVDNSGATFPSPEIDASSGASTYTPGAPLAGNPATTYWWRVRPTDVANNLGNWSAIFTFTLNTVPPDAPTALGQFKNDGVTAIAIGGSTTENVVKFQATISDPAGEQVQLHVQVALVGDDNFTAPQSATSPLGGAGTVQVSITPLTPNPYHWRCRTIDVLGNVSAWVSFGGNPEASADFSVVTNSPPASPANAKQYKSNGVTLIATGAATNETTVVFKADVSDPDGNTVKIQIELQPAGTGFTGTFTNESAFFASGTTAQLTVTGIGDNTSYHWQVRAVDPDGAPSAWVAYDPAATHFSVDTTPAPPNTPTGLGQFKLNGTTVIGVGATTNELGVIFRGTLTDTDPGAQIRIQVEIKEVGVAFDGAGLVTSAAVASGQQASVQFNGLTDTKDYHWRARAIDDTDLTSGWQNFPIAPTNFETDPDFHVSTTNTNPNLPTGLGQYKNNGVTVIGIGATTDESVVKLKATVSDNDAGQQVRLEVELRDINTDFTGVPTHTGAFVASGTLVEITAMSLAQIGHHWRARTADDAGGASAWVVFGGNADLPLPAASDFVVDTNDAPTVSGLGQFRTDNSVIAVGATTAESSVVFKGTMTDADGANTVKFQVEVQLVGTPFTGTFTAETALLANGSLATLQINGLVAGSYHWQARAVDNLGLAGPWSSFGGNSEGPPAAVDFTVIVNSMPTFSGAGQFKADGTTVIAAGATTGETTVVIKATVSDADAGQQVKLQVELRPLATPFTSPATPVIDNVIFFESAAVSSGSIATVTMSGLAPGDYHWQARSVDDQAPPGTSAWAANGGSPDFHVNAAPVDPVTLGQFRMDTTTAIAAGGTTNETGVVFKADISDVASEAGQQIRLQIEVKDNAVAFDGTISGQSAFVVSGASAVTVSVTVTGLANGSYHWRARTLDEHGGASNWVAFGNSPDFVVNTAGTTAPTIGPGPTQHDESPDPAAANGFIDQDNQMVFKATVNDTDGQLVKFQIELTGPGGTTQYESAFLASGTEAVITVPALAVGDYTWQFRAVDTGDNASAWTPFDATTPNFTINAQPQLPANLGQFKSDGSTVLNVGDSTNEPNVIIKADVADTAPDADPCQLEVEFKNTGVVFDGTGTVLSGSIASGTQATVAITGLSNGNYHWRVRTIDSKGGQSAWVTFGGNGEPSGIDVTVFVNNPPNVPSGLGQFKANGVTAIPTGGTTDETTVVVKATVSDPDAGQQLRLQVEIRPVGVAFTNLQGPGDAIGNGVFFEGPPVANGQIAGATLSPLADGTSYHWQLRVVDSLGTASAWTPYGGNADPAGVDLTVSVPAGNSPPFAPTLLEQNKADGFSPIAIGATTNENVVVFKGGVTDPEGGSVKLQIEIKPAGTAFSGAVSVESPFVSSGTIATAMLSSISDGDYHWQARTVDAAGLASLWSPFGGNPEPAGIDFTVDTSSNTAPPVPTGPGQFQLDGTTAIAVGATTTESGVTFKAVVTDGDAGQSVKFQVEVKVVGISFDGAISAESAFLSPGDQATVVVSALGNENYHWRCRTVDSAGAASAWLAFGGNPETTADFVVNAAANTAPGAPTGPGQFMTDDTAIGVGGTTVESTVVFKATVADPDGGTVKLRVEVKDVTLPFDGLTDLFEGGFVSSGTEASVTVGGLGNSAYHWRAWAVDPSGAVSPATAFGANVDEPVSPPNSATDFAVDTTANLPPAPPGAPNQTRTSGAPIGVGGSTNESTIHFTASVSDAQGGLVRLQVEIQAVGVPFTGNPTGSGPWVTSGSTTTVVHGSLVDGTSYYWQARTMDSGGLTSAWFDFGANGGGTDFTKVPNTAPSAPSNLDQLFANGFSIPVGSETPESSVILQAIVIDADGDALTLQVEVRPVGFAFTNGVMGSSPATGSGNAAQINYSALVNGTGYHWQARVIDSSGAASAWVSFGGNAESEADFIRNASAVLNSAGSSNRGDGGSGCGLGSVKSPTLGWVLALAAVLLLAVLRRRS